MRTGFSRSATRYAASFLFLLGISTAASAVVTPPLIIKAFGAASVPLNGSTSLTFTIQNNDPVAIQTGIAFTDTFPSGLVVATPNGLSGTCGGGPITAIAGSGSVSLSGATLAAGGGSCTFAVNVTGSTAGQKNNTTGNVSSNEGGTGGTASASLTVIAPPALAKVFNQNPIAQGGTTSLTFTTTNSNTADALTGVGFTDTLPAGLTVPNASATVCGGTVTLTNPSTISMTGATIAASNLCQFSVTVTGAAAGSFTNTTGNVTSTNGGTGNVSSASLVVLAPPTITKSFGASNIPLNGTTTLSATIANPNTLAVGNLAFTDNFPAGIVVAATPLVVNSCGGTATAVAGAGTLSLSGGTVPASGSCTIGVAVQGTSGGIKNNTFTATSDGGTSISSTASITVVAPPIIIKAFGAASVPLNGSTSLQFIIQNNNATVGLTGVAFNDTLPAGLVVATPNGLAGACGAGTITATAGSGSVSLVGGTIGASSSCTFSINVTGTTAGLKSNTTSQVTATESGTGGTASTSLNVLAPPVIAKSFNPSPIATGGTTSLTFTITNPAPNAAALTGVAFSDTLPAGLTVPNASATVCGGTVTLTNPVTITHTGATIAAGNQCQFSVTVTGTVAGNYTNTTGAVTATNAGTGNVATASLVVTPTPPLIIKSFGAASIPLNGSTSLQFNIQNNNASATLTGVAFTDALPAGLVVATPNGLTGSCGGGTITAAAGSGSVSLSGATLAGSSACTFSINVTGTSGGQKNNTTGNVTATESGAGGTASASLAVVAPPTIAKVFNPDPIAPGGTTSLTFTMTNPNTVALTGVAFSDTLPSGLTVPNASATVCGGTVTLTAPTSITHTGATIAAGGQCIFSVTVTGVSAGLYTNTTGAVSSTNGGTGNTASAGLVVGVAPTITKSFGAASMPLNGTTTLNVTITNPNAGFALPSVAFTDTFPAGLVVGPTPGVTNTCGGSVTAAAGAGSLVLAGGTIAASGSCTVVVTVQGTSAGVKNNSVQATSGGATTNTANASITVVAPPVIIKAFGAATIAAAASTSLTFTLQNNNASTALTGVAFTDTLPAGLIVATPNGLTGSCGGGTITAAAAGGTIALTGGSIAASASCTFSVNVTGITGGVKNNTTGTVTSVEGGTGGTASASVTVTGGVVTSFSGPTATGTGTATVSITGGGPTCGFAPQGTGPLQSAFFIPVTGSPKSPATPPPGGFTFPEGLLDFVLTACNGTPVTFTVTYPVALPPGAVYWKYGPTAANTTPHWYQLPATFGPNTATFTITDGGLGDDDLTVNGTIVDQGGPGIPGGPGAGSSLTQVPTLSEAMLALMALLLAALGAWRMRRAGLRHGSS